MRRQGSIDVRRRGPLLEVTLDRAEKANALSQAMLHALRDLFNEVADDAAVHAMAITGAGERVFCGGADLTELSADPDDPRSTIWDEMAGALAKLSILTVAAINGPCIGGGLTLALGCDIRIGVPEARFGYPVLKNGVLPGAIDAARLRALVGPGRAAALLLGAESLDAETALAWGLLDRMVPRAGLNDAVEAVTRTACAADRNHLAALKRLTRGD